MIKRIIACILSLFIFFCAGCKENDPDIPDGIVDPIKKLALITSDVDIEVDFTYAAIWEGIVSCSEANSLNYSYYRVMDMTAEAMTQQFEAAIEDGATVVVCAGDEFAPAIKSMQDKYRQIKFIAIDVPGEEIGEVNKNTHTVMFRQEQGGYLAGYGAVKDGFTKLAFMGDHPSVTYSSYANGFVQGANDAAVILNTPIEIKISYKTDHESNDAALNVIDSWYKEGTELVMISTDDAFTQNCASIAVNNLGYIIGTNNDQSHLGANLDYNPFITSAMKGLREAVDATLEMTLAGSWDESLSGKTLYFGLQNGNYIYMPEYEATWLFKGFSLEEYNTLKSQISNGEILIDGSKLPSVSELVTIK